MKGKANKQTLPMIFKNFEGELVQIPEWALDPGRTEVKRRRAKFTFECAKQNPHLLAKIIPLKEKVPKKQTKKPQEPRPPKVVKPRREKLVIPKAPKVPRVKKPQKYFIFGPVWCERVRLEPKKVFDHPKLIAHALALGLFGTEEEAKELSFDALKDLMRIALSDVPPEPISLELEPSLRFWKK